MNFGYHIEEHGDADVVNYCLSAEDRDFDFEDPRRMKKWNFIQQRR